MLSTLKKWLKLTPAELPIWQEQWSKFLQKNIAFYRVLSDSDKKSLNRAFNYF